MKKDFLLIAAAATMLTACVNLDTLQDINIQQDGENDGSIGFAPFAENITKAENSSALYTESFLAHHNNFAVWGYKQRDNAEQVFGTTVSEGTSTEGTIVTVAGTVESPTYTYSPLRFWDKTATKYEFYAAAPATLPNSEVWTFHEGSAIDNGYFTTTSELTGINLKDHDAIAESTSGAGDAVAAGVPGTTLTNNFKRTGDVDRLIAAKSEVVQSRYNTPSPDKVHLNFIHILSKLNISIKKNTTTLPDATYTVVLKEFGVYNMPGKGDFNESTTPLADGTKKNNHWSLTAYNTESDDSYNHSLKINYLAPTLSSSPFTVTGTANYIVESLVIPQNISYERVALDGKAHELEAEITAQYFDTYTEYTTARPKEYPELTEAAFQAILEKDDNDRTAAEKEAITKVHAKPEVAAYLKVENAAYVAGTAHSSQPYFKITYTINGEEFTAYYNLVAAFKGYDNDGHLASDHTTAITENTLAFNEGWQNTLNIIINPTAIEFTADVAKWADDYSNTPEYEIIK